MKARTLNASGAVAAALVTLIVLAVMAGAGIFIYHRNHKTKSVGSTLGSPKNSSTSTKSATTADPYAGWKTYSDSQSYYSFKYPADWSIDVTSAQVTVLDPAKSVEVDYIGRYAHDSGLLGFNPVSVDPLSVGGVSLKVVGGVYTPANEADYAVVDSSLLRSNPLTIGQATLFPNALRFTDVNNDTNAVAFRARYGSQFSSADDAKAWFGTSDAKMVLLILQSLTYNR